MSPAEITLPERMNAAVEFVDANLAAGRESKIAVRVTDGREFSYGAIAELVNRAGNGLRDLGIDLEQRVVLLLPDGPEFVGAFFGAIKAGIVPVPLNTLLKSADYEYLLADSRARALVVSEELLPTVEPILGSLRHLRHVIVADGASTPAETVAGSVSAHTFDAMTAAAASDLDPEIMSKDDPCFWLYSSGTTGFPKGTVHLQHDMLVCADTYARQVLGMTEDDVTYSVAKLFFAYGLGNALYFPFRFGATTVLHPGRPEPAAVFENLRRYQPTVFYSVPTGYGAMLAYDDASEANAFERLRVCVSAGEALPQALYERWRARYGVEILDGIGSTEVLQMFISNRPGEVVPGSSGKLVPGYEARIVDADDNPVPEGEVGDLLIKGDSTCAYYWNRHEQTKQTIVGEWIRTGDKYRVDAAGNYWYQGRTDDMLKVGGIWVSPFEVEAAVLEHSDVLETAVVGYEDEQRLVKPKAFVVLRTEARGTDPAAKAREIQDFVKSRIAAYKYPRAIEFVDQLPKTATGKIQRYRLRAGEHAG